MDTGNTNPIPDLKKINGAGKHLLALFNDILDISQIEAGKMDLYLETFDLKTMLEDVVATTLLLVQKNPTSSKSAWRRTWTRCAPTSPKCGRHCSIC